MVDNFGDRRDALQRQRLAQLYIDDRIKELLIERWRAALQARRDPGPEMSILKLHSCRHNIELVHMLTEVLGPRLAADTAEWGAFAWNEYVFSTPGPASAAAPRRSCATRWGRRSWASPRSPAPDACGGQVGVGSTGGQMR